MIRFSAMILLLTLSASAMAADSTRTQSSEPSIEQLAEGFRTSSELETIRVLTVTATHGYRHTAAIAATGALLGALNQTTEFAFDFTENVDDLNTTNLKKYDLLFFANSTLRVDEPTADVSGAKTTVDRSQARRVEHPVTAEHRAAIIEFLVNGGGLVGAHAALDAFYGWGEYRQLVGGGLFESHPWTQQVRILIEDSDNPSTTHLGDEFLITDEIYVLDQNPRRNSHVLASLDTTSVGIEQGPAAASRNDFPISWMREHKGGRVFITKLGHFPQVWMDPAFIQHLLQGMRMAAGRIPANFASQRVPL